MNIDQETASGVRANVYIKIAGSNLDPRFEAYMTESEKIGKYVDPRFTKAVAEEVVSWANRIAEGGDDFPVCEWSREGYVLVFTPDSPLQPSAVVQPDDDGLYALRLGWAWQCEEAAER